MSMMKVIDLMRILVKHDPDSSIDEVFNDETNSDICRDIINTINSSNAPSRLDKRSRKDRAIRAVKEAGNAEFGTSFGPLLVEWKEEPSKFFEPWSLQSEDVDAGLDCVEIAPSDHDSESTGAESDNFSIDSVPENVETGPKRSSLAADFHRSVSQTRQIVLRKQADSIRWIFHTLFFRDVLIQLTRSKEDIGFLPRGKALRPLIKEACRQITGEPILSKTVDDVAAWVKAGQLYHLISAEVGGGSLFLLSDHLCKDKWTTNLPKTSSSLALVLEPLKNSVLEEVKKSSANDVAKGIRDFQLEPYQSIKSKDCKKRKRNDQRSEIRWTKQKTEEQAMHIVPISMVRDNENQSTSLDSFDVFKQEFNYLQGEITSHFQPDLRRLQPDLR